MDYSAKQRRLLKQAIVIVISICLISISLLLFRPPNLLLSVLISLLSIALVLFLERLANRYINSYTSFKKGEKSESIVREALTKIPDILVVNNFEIPGHKGDIDHLVICSGGVFMLDSKFRSGYLNAQGDNWWVRKPNGSIVKEKDHLNVVAKRHAVAVSDYIKQEVGVDVGFVKAVIVITSGFDINYINTDVDVLAPGELKGYFEYKNKLRRLDEGDIQRIHREAERLKGLLI